MLALAVFGFEHGGSMDIVVTAELSTPAGPVGPFVANRTAMYYMYVCDEHAAGAVRAADAKGAPTFCASGAYAATPPTGCDGFPFGVPDTKYKIYL